MRNETKSTFLPLVRCEPSLKERLERITERSVAPSLADHIRFAIERYVTEEERRNAEMMIAQP